MRGKEENGGNIFLISFSMHISSSVRKIKGIQCDINRKYFLPYLFPSFFPFSFTYCFLVCVYGILGNARHVSMSTSSILHT